MDDIFRIRKRITPRYEHPRQEHIFRELEKRGVMVGFYNSEVGQILYFFYRDVDNALSQWNVVIPIGDERDKELIDFVYKEHKRLSKPESKTAP